MSSVLSCPQCPSAFKHQWELDKHVVTHARLFTMDNYLITDSMPVWDYNLDVVTVDLSYVSPESSGDVWFSTKKPDGSRGPLMNGDRVRTRHPSTNRSAIDAWNELTKPVNLNTVAVEITWSDGSVFSWAEVPEDKVEALQDLLGHTYDLKV